MSKQLKKYMAVTTASFMVMQLAACGSATEENTENIHTIPSDMENTGAETTYANEEGEAEGIYEVPDNMTPEEYANAVIREQLEDVSESDMANACEEWQEDEDGSFECLDEDSPYYSQHFFNGLMFATAGAMIGSSIYKSHNLKNGAEKERIRRSAIVSPTNIRDKANDQNNANSGGGGGSSYTGRSKTNTNGTATNGNTNGSKSNTSNGTTTNSSNATSNGTNSNNSNSYSSGTNSNSSNSYSNSSSSNSGKSGFGSGGGSRGGSSSS
ncbi:hypothetical protein ACIQZG_12735 [Lysinibacillus sp. NPDC096418]|uniref:hypothetical protein n=1 Tax=Lysinibacillus sp. NPDC096418 TaxID=3364138 RepID=UPI00382B09CA